MSKRSIANKFHFLLQYTLIEYYTTIKMEYAQALLFQNKSVKEVAMILRYKKISHFSRAFKRVMNSSPSSCHCKSSAVKFAKIGNQKFFAI